MVRLDQPLDSSSAILGQSWTGTLVNDIPIGNRVALKSGTPVDGLVVAVKRSGHFRTSGALSLRSDPYQRCRGCDGRAHP